MHRTMRIGMGVVLGILVLIVILFIIPLPRNSAPLLVSVGIELGENSEILLDIEARTSGYCGGTTLSGVDLAYESHTLHVSVGHIRGSSPLLLRCKSINMAAMKKPLDAGWLREITDADIVIPIAGQQNVFHLTRANGVLRMAQKSGMSAQMEGGKQTESMEVPFP